MVLRIIGAIVLLVVIVFGYFFSRDKIIESKLDEYSLYAGVIAETSIAATLYRNQSDSFIVARDSILQQYDLTMDDIETFREKMQSKPNDWRIVFDMVAYMTDSVVELRSQRDKIIKDSVSDSTSNIK